jgi:prepilin-type N-terminal cleavage/methylation domain-containing protein
MTKSYHVQINQTKNRSDLNSAINLSKQRGYNLVELMVASIISVIILLAASSTFLTTYQLKEQVKTRINYEQDVRNAANLLRSDARQLGNFSCLNPPTASNLNSIFNGSFTEANNKQFLSTRFVGNIGVTPTGGSQQLIMTYINGTYASSLVGTDCNNNIPNLANRVDAAVYIVGTTASDAVSGLYRVNYSGGRWSAPQLLVSNVSNVQYSFDYDGHIDAGTNANCPQSLPQSNTPTEAVTNFKSNHLNFNYDKPPVLIRTTLTITPLQASENVNNVNYVINAMVRSGEVCINNQVKKQ